MRDISAKTAGNRVEHPFVVARANQPKFLKCSVMALDHPGVPHGPDVTDPPYAQRPRSLRRQRPFEFLAVTLPFFQISHRLFSFCQEIVQIAEFSSRIQSLTYQLLLSFLIQSFTFNNFLTSNTLNRQVEVAQQSPSPIANLQ